MISETQFTTIFCLDSYCCIRMSKQATHFSSLAEYPSYKLCGCTYVLGLKRIVNLLSGYPDTNTSRISYG